MRVITKITKDPVTRRVVERFGRDRHGGRTIGVNISGLWGSSAPILCVVVAKALGRPLLYATAHQDEADEILDDIETVTEQKCALLAAWETVPGEGSGFGEIHDERLQLCAQLRGRMPAVVVAPIQALLHPVPGGEALERNTLRLKVGDKRGPGDIVAWLVDRGFERLDRVEAPGDFAQRGDIVDVYAPDRDDPVRIEFFDDAVEAVRTFDAVTQRSNRKLETLRLTALPHHQQLSDADQVPFLDYLPDDTIVVLDRPADVQEMGATLWNRLNQPDGMIPPDQVLRRLADFDQLQVTRIGVAAGATDDVFHFDVHSLARFEGNAETAVRELCQASESHSVTVYCANEGERKRLKELIVEHSGRMPGTIECVLGLLRHGFEWRSANTIVVPHHEIFHRTPGRKLRRAQASRAIESVLDLIPGDLIVHLAHGIARYCGMKTMRKPGSDKVEEFLTLEFADDATLHVTMSHIDLIQKYVGAAGIKPTLSKLGGTRWKNTRDKVTDAVDELAESLLRIQVEREQSDGIAYPADTQWQREFEESFAYVDTEDQTITGGEIKGDLTRSKPMDRLLCGDVGFGKTELAIRAAFKVVEYGKQVAILVPTTVLAEQHRRTFSERLAEYPFVVGCLSRFKTAGDQKRIVEAAKKGRVDILIGTHRLLSKDVGFADLGLVIIDEEQRFGVEHKERLKKLRATVDVLSLSATPIPRTLHMALVGIRDISALQTPPLDRRAIVSHVSNYDGESIRNAILRELNRDGQVYFIHNIVHSIQTVADDIRKLVPEARVIVGHGQMKMGELERVMHAFVHRKADILVATTIIESGIDIPTVNTIFINNADRFGLADLHQLRGRVGRSSHRGYCHFLLPASRPVTPKAAKRLKAIEEFSELGAGFRIAMRDLEIRGAGNMLGGEQSGHIAAVGYELYCQLLEAAVNRAQGKPDARPKPVHLELNIQAHIPRAYIAAEQTRIDVYRRIKACFTPDALTQLDTDLRDAFGAPPDPVQRLLDLAEIRVLAASWQIKTIILKSPDVIFTVKDFKRVQDLFADAPGSVRTPDPRTVHLRLPPAYLEPQSLLPILRRLLNSRTAIPK